MDDCEWIHGKTSRRTSQGYVKRCNISLSLSLFPSLALALSLSRALSLYLCFLALRKTARSDTHTICSSIVLFDLSSPAHCRSQTFLPSLRQTHILIHTHTYPHIFDRDYGYNESLLIVQATFHLRDPVSSFPIFLSRRYAHSHRQTNRPAQTDR